MDENCQVHHQLPHVCVHWQATEQRASQRRRLLESERHVLSHKDLLLDTPTQCNIEDVCMHGWEDSANKGGSPAAGTHIHAVRAGCRWAGGERVLPHVQCSYDCEP